MCSIKWCMMEVGIEITVYECISPITFPLVSRKTEKILHRIFTDNSGVSIKHKAGSGGCDLPDLALAPDIVVKEYGRRGRSCYRAFSVLRVHNTRLIGHYYGPGRIWQR